MAVIPLQSLATYRFDPIDRFTLLVPWLSVGLPAALWTLGFDVPHRYRWTPLLVSIVVFGLPHGAIDHLAIPRVRGQRPSFRWLGVIGILYLGLGGAYAIVWFLVPTVAVVGFILLTWVHWGQGDLHPLRAVLGVTYLDTPLARGLQIAVRGGLPMLVPLVSHPHRYRAVLGRLLELFGLGTVGLEWLGTPRLGLTLGLMFGGLTLLTLGAGYFRAGPSRRAWAIDAGEVVLLWWCFWVVPPLVAVGVYFAMWHSVRHVGRLMAIDDRSDTFSNSLIGFARDAIPLSVVSLGLLAALALMVPRTPGTVPDLLALYLVLIAVLTLPHVAVVAVIDREQGIW